MRFSNNCGFPTFYAGAATAVLVWQCTDLVLQAYAAKNATIISILGAFGYVLTPLVWEYSITAEVFALNNFICAVLLYFTCLVLATAATVHDKAGVPQKESTGAARNTLFSSALVGGLFCGLALANQHSSLLLVAYVVPCILSCVLFLTPQYLPGVLFRSATSFLFGLSTYLYLPWAAVEPTRGSWGDLGTLAGFIKHVLRAEYGTFRLGMIVGSETWYQRIAIYLRHTSEESFHVMFPLLAAGVAVHMWSSRSRSASRPLGGAHAAATATVSNKTKACASKSGKKAQTKEIVVAVPNDDPVHGKMTGSAGRLLVVNLGGMWVFYTLIWHCVLSNLPLSSPMPFAVHSRFWMQPNLLLYVLLGVAVGKIADYATTKSTKSTAPTTTLFASATSAAVVALYLSAVVYQRYAMMDKSSSGDVLHSYASALMSSVMPNRAFIATAGAAGGSAEKYHSLLLSHTDLDWNPVRYIQHCEGVGLEPSEFYRKSPLARIFGRPDTPQIGTADPGAGDLVTHLSFQLIPYPWFAETQQQLYPHVRFPPTNFPGMSTDRSSEGNAQLILRFLHANNAHNATYTVVPRVFSQASQTSQSSDLLLPVIRSTHDIFPGGVYLDMQAVLEAEIAEMGQWRGLFLVPWGTVYRVFGPLNVQQIMELHHHSWHHLKMLQSTFPPVDDGFALKFAPGSWERAAANVYYDAHNQFGLNILTFAIELQSNINMKLMPVLMDRYLLSASVLQQTQAAVHKYGTFSSSVADLSKNTALAWMRLAALIDIVQKFRQEVTAEFAALLPNVGAELLRPKWHISIPLWQLIATSLYCWLLYSERCM